MKHSKLRADAESIWQAGVQAVDSGQLVRNAVQIVRGPGRPSSKLRIADTQVELGHIGRIAVVGAGKAGAGMAAAIEEILREHDETLLDRLTGWVNVPADCVRPLRKIHLHAARAAGVNEPTAEGVLGSERILQIVGDLKPGDLCIVLISGGGSALLPAPVPDISLADKLAVTRLLMQSGATIGELNCVRKHLSRIKGGKLGRASRAGMTFSLIISDIIGDPLDLIASGPTVADRSMPSQAIEVLERFAPDQTSVPESVWKYLAAAARNPSTETAPVPPGVRNIVIGNNAVALDAAAAQARHLGYEVESLGSDNAGIARDVGRDLAIRCRLLRSTPATKSKPVCILSGGEPVVQLATTDQPRQGGRNQEVALAALLELWNDGVERIAILSGGTDGEDGPTDAAGAVVDSQVLQSAQTRNLDPDTFLAVNNAYPFFEATGGLLKTGPTHTNVMDLRVAIVG